MERIYACVNRFLESVMALLMVFIVILLFTEVVSRYVFNSPISWAEEMATYAFIWMVYIGAGVAFYRHAHIRVDYLSLKMDERVLRRVELGINLIMAAFFILLVIFGLKFSIPNWGADSYTLPLVKLGWIHIAVPVGALLMLCNVARNVFLIYGGRNKNKE